MRKSLSPKVVVLAVAAAAVMVWQVAGIGVATAQTNITFADEQGRPVGLDAFKGQLLILDFWATWCKPCRDEFPVLDRLQARYGLQGLAVVPVSVDREGQIAVNAFYKRLNIVNLAKYTGSMREIVNAFSLRGLPTTFVFDRDGKEVLRVEGPADWEGAEIDALLTRLLAR
jgi:thiol-disulfide isomerase/thioredoxin